MLVVPSMALCHILLYRSITVPAQCVPQHHLFSKALLRRPCCGNNNNQQSARERSFRQRKVVAKSTASGAAPGAGTMRVWAVSDVHSDYKENMAW